MPPSFKIEVFKRRLAETIAWCQPRFSIDRIPQCLRTHPYPDEKVIEDYEIVDNVPILYPNLEHIAPFAFHSVFKKRAEAFPEENSEKYSGLCGGRLLVNYFAHETCEGTSPPETVSFIDSCDTAAWDTWVYYGYGTSNLHKYSPYPYLISWMPPEMLSLVNYAVDVNSLEAIQWIENANPPFDFYDEIKQAGLFFNEDTV